MSWNDVNSDRQYALGAPRMDPNRRISEQDCHQALNSDGGNLLCIR